MTQQVPIQLPNDQPAPSTYELTQSQTLSPKSAVATFDGSGAAGNFLCALSFYAQNGALVTRVFPSTPVVAGDVAAVSYAPFPGGLISGGGGGGGITEITSVAGTIIVTDPTGPIVDLDAPGSFVGDVETLGASATPGAGGQADFSWSHTSGTAIVDLTTPTQPKILTTGVYLFLVTVTRDIGGGVTTNFVRWGFVNFSTSTEVAGNPIPLAADQPTLTSMAYANTYAAGDEVGVQYNNDSAGTVVLGAVMTICHLGS